jgi:membrane fusion protein (multidrug efflux system)
VTLPRAIATVGSLRSPQMTTVAAEIGGTLTAVDVPEGRAVEKGHVLARLDDTEARAAVAVARARHHEATERIERVRSLRGAGVSSAEELDGAIATYEATLGQLEEAEGRLADTVIRAPFDGVVGLRDAGLYAGSVVRTGDPIVQITRTGALEALFHVPQRHAQEIAVGQPVSGLEGVCGLRFDGRVNAIDPRVDPNTRMIGVLAVVPEPPEGLLSGMAIRVRVQVGEMPGSILVPQEAIVRQGTKFLAWVVDEESTASSREVVPGEYFVDGVHVREGLAPGDRVVTAGQQKLRPGAEVAPEEYRPIENPNLALGRLAPPGDCEP